jgi:hypothetical protein
MRALHTLLIWGTDDGPGNSPGHERALHDLIGRLTVPGVLQYAANAVEQRVATLGTSFTAVIDRLTATSSAPPARAAAALLAARAAEGAGDSDTAERLVHQALERQPGLLPALMDCLDLLLARDGAARRFLRQRGTSSSAGSSATATARECWASPPWSTASDAASFST